MLYFDARDTRRVLVCAIIILKCHACFRAAYRVVGVFGDVGLFRPRAQNSDLFFRLVDFLFFFLLFCFGPSSPAGITRSYATAEDPFQHRPST